jgi:hypothetical protein
MQDLSVADINITINHEPRIADVRLGQALGFAQPRDIRKLVERHREPLEQFGSIPREKLLARHDGALSDPDDTDAHGFIAPPDDALTDGDKARRAVQAYWLNRRQALYLCTKSETERATEVTIAMVEVFDQYLRGQLAPKPIDPAQLSPQQRSAIHRRAQELLKPLLRDLETRMEAALIERIAALVASGQLPDIPRLYAELPELAALPAPAEPAAEAIGFEAWCELFRSAEQNARPGTGAVFIGDNIVLFETQDVAFREQTITLTGKMYGRTAATRMLPPPRGSC